MAVRVEPKKPQLQLLPFVTARNPSKNYAFTLLYSFIQDVKPARSLDAGTGELRNRWMFPGTYLGITIYAEEYQKGLIRTGKAPIKQSGPTEVYLTRLESDFSFLGPVDLVTCSHTIVYVEDREDVLSRLAAIVRQGGGLFLLDEMAGLDTALRVLEPLFDDIQLVYTAYEGIDVPDFDGSDAEVASLTNMEMRLPNARDGHALFALMARGKRTPAIAPSPLPEIIDDRGLRIVKRELPFLPQGPSPGP